MGAATIKLFLQTGEAESLRTAELLNWTGKAVASPRSELQALLARSELGKSGIYILTGVDPDSGKQAAYIGEAEDVRDRLKEQVKKEFWVQAIVFVSKDENLTKSHIRYLEGRLIEEGKKIGRFLLLNGQASGSKLPESDREDMEAFLVRIRQLLPVLGCEILVPLVQIAGAVGKTVLFSKTKGLSSRGQRTAKGFVVFAGSEAVPELRPSAVPYIAATRNQLKADGTLVDEKIRLRFTKDTEFSSPSMAGTIICGGQTNGLIFWKDKDGRDLKEIESLSRPL